MTELEKVQAKIAEFDLDGRVREINALLAAKSQDCAERLRAMLREAGIYDEFNAVEVERIEARKAAEAAVKKAHQTFAELKAAEKVLQSLADADAAPAARPPLEAIDGGAKPEPAQDRIESDPDFDPSGEPVRIEKATDSFVGAAPE